MNIGFNVLISRKHSPGLQLNQKIQKLYRPSHCFLEADEMVQKTWSSCRTGHSHQYEELSNRSGLHSVL